MEKLKDFVAVGFSKNRPLQCDLTLKTLFLQCKEPVGVNIVYKCDKEYENSYNTLIGEHPEVNFVKQGSFKDDLVSLLGSNKHVLFFVDDCIFTHSFYPSIHVGQLEKYQTILGVSLRLGRNTSYCYPVDKEQKFPTDCFRSSEEQILFNWMKSELDFAYPLELSSSIYRAKDILQLISPFNFGNPNDLEAILSGMLTYCLVRPHLICYDTSRAFCSPMNKVQSVALSNRAGNAHTYSPQNLLILYEKWGCRLNPASWDGFVSNGCHQEVEFV